MREALYGPDGFFVRPGADPTAHFVTSATSPLFAAAVLRLLEVVDAALDRPDPLTVVDLGAGRGDLLRHLLAQAPPGLRARLRPVAVEIGPALVATDGVVRADRAPRDVTGLVVAAEYLDTVPVDVAEVDDHGVARYVLVDEAGAETLGERVTGPDAAWLARWWPLAQPGERAEIGRPRDEAWAAAVSTLRRGLALAVDYGHSADRRPPVGTLTGYRSGRRVPPVPDGSCDLTAHVALDAVAEAGRRVRPGEPVLVRQAEALRALGVTGRRPPLALADRDPAAYLRGLATAGRAATLTDPDGLGGHHWLLHSVDLPRPVWPPVAR